MEGRGKPLEVDHAIIQSRLRCKLVPHFLSPDTLPSTHMHVIIHLPNKAKGEHACVLNLYVRLSMVTSWRARAAQLLCIGNLCAVPWRHACSPMIQTFSSAHAPSRVVHHHWAPFPCRPDPDLASLRKGRDHQQHTVQERAEGWAALTGTHETCVLVGGGPRNLALPPGWPPDPLPDR